MTPVESNRGRARRRGLASVAVLVALIVVGLVCAGLLRVALARRSSTASSERRLQAAWLAESGLDRASARLSASSTYTGETWEVPAADLGGRGAGSVLIRVEPVADHPDRRRVLVRADYPSGSTLRSRRAVEAVIPVIPNPR